MKTFIFSILIAASFLTFQSCKKSSVAPKRVAVEYMEINTHDSVVILNDAANSIGSLIFIYGGNGSPIDIGDSVKIGNNSYYVISSESGMIGGTGLQNYYRIQLNVVVPTGTLYDQDIIFYHNNLQ